jgi:hypothetical protein
MASAETILGISPFVFVFTQLLISVAALGSAKLSEAALALNTDGQACEVHLACDRGVQQHQIPNFHILPPQQPPACAYVNPR